jgi:hypothetical protein
MTGRGGLAINLINGTGKASVRGWAVTPHTSSGTGYYMQCSSGFDVIGFVYDAVPANESGWVVTNGIADVMIGGGACRAGDIVMGWTGSLAVDGFRVGVCSASYTAQLATGPGTTGIHDLHFREVGHVLETHVSGSNYTVQVAIHFN